MHPFPAEHDQQQAEALEILKNADSFILVYFNDTDPEECDNPLCGIMHSHRTTSMIASCASQDLHGAMNAIGQEILISTSVDALMALSESQRDQIAGLLRGEQPFLRVRDDEADDEA